MKRFIYIIISICFCARPALSKDTVRLKLDDAIGIGISRSLDAVIAKSSYISSYWAYRTYKAELLPEVTLRGTLPSYTKSYASYQNPDGTWTYVKNDYNKINGGFSVSQNLPFTGGSVSLNSTFERYEQNGNNGNTNYKVMPVQVQYRQPLWGFNRVKWMQRIEPIRYNGAKQTFICEHENIALNVITAYFNLLISRVNMEIGIQNLEKTKQLYKIEEAKFDIGQKSEMDLMSMKSNLLSAEANLKNVQSSLDANMFNLRSLLGFGENYIIEPVIPDFITDDIPEIPYHEVLALAHENNPFIQEIIVTILEAERNVSQAKAERRDISLYSTFGMSGNHKNFNKTLTRHNRQDDLYMELGVSIPILDWGKRKGRVRVMEAQKEVTKTRMEKEKQDFNQDIFLLVQDFNNQPYLLRLAQEKDTIAQKRYNAAVEAFIQGSVDVIYLNDAQASKDSAKSDYIREMYLLWYYYYKLRAFTLYDFIQAHHLEAEYPI